MRKDTEKMMKGVAIGALAGTAMGAVGTYVAKTNPKQMKKMVHKAAKTGEHLTQNVPQNVEKILISY